MSLVVDLQPIRNWLYKISEFLDVFKWMADGFVLDFYVENHWQRLPEPWRTFLSQLTPHELALMIDAGEDIHWGQICQRLGVVAPLSLLAFRKCVSTLALSRRYEEDDCNKIGTINQPRVFTEYHNCFNRHVKSKKRHEIAKFGELVAKLSEEKKVCSIFDVGSGVGHLARYMTYVLGLNVTSIDCVDQFGESATKFDKELKKILLRRAEHELPRAPTHLCLKLELNKHESHLQVQNDFGIIGLHTCGNLAPVILHNFVNSPAKFVASVGCCYMKMDENGFPISQFGKSVPLSLSYEALEVACHAVEQYVQKLKQGLVKKLMTHSYRATLETILMKHFQLRRVGLKGVKNCELLRFDEYAFKATEDLGVELTEEMVCNETINNCIKDWYKVVIFYSLRLMLANIIESLVILDRALFLKEKAPTCSVSIETLFNPTVSPRNFVIIAERQT